jgi:uncharacterized membrane-anchored protein YjiN (DUF445 family)
MAGKVSTKYLGIISLCIAASGFVILLLILHFKIIGGFTAQILAILLAGFEAGTAGALADWFAVRALFQKIPIPLMQRHTNIIIKNRQRITDGIVNMVVNHWLSKESLEKRLGDISVSTEVIHYLEKPDGKENGITVIRELLCQFVQELDSPELAGVLERVLKNQIGTPEIMSRFSKGIQKYVQEGGHYPLLQNLFESLEKTISEPDVISIISKKLQEIAQEYGEKDALKKVGVWLGEKFHVLNYDTFAEVIIKKSRQLIKEARDNSDHPFRLKINAVIEDMVNGLANNDPKYIGFVETMQKKLIENTELKSFIQQTLQRFKGTVLEQLRNNDTDLMKLIGHYLDKTLESLRSDEIMRRRIDDWTRQQLGDFIHNNHNRIGDIVRENIDKLNNQELIESIESNVGGELQYIRLNGALVGGFAGLIFGIVRIFLA